VTARGRRRFPGGLRLRRTPSATVPATVLELARSGPVPLSPEPVDPGGRLSIATVIPPFRRGSGGHSTIVRLMRELTRLGHPVSLWLDDFDASAAGDPSAVLQRNFADFFGAADLPLRVGFDGWTGADVVLATGWQTVSRVLLLPGARARAYLVQDHEPDFYGPSAEALFAQQTYEQGLHCIAASPWLAGLLRDRYGAEASHFDLGVDHSVHHPADPPAGAGRREDLVVFYARVATPRRAVPLGLLALEELARRRPQLEIALFGNEWPVPVSFAHARLGVVESATLAELYSRATVGMVFSLTNPSLIGLEMMAAGLPCVELASEPMLATFGADGPLQLADPDPLAVCGALERLLDDRALRERIAQDGIALTESRTWSRAAAQVHDSLRIACTRQNAGRAST
jgi:glycosyltransferase involved in cell wall biosynthesis